MKRTATFLLVVTAAITFATLSADAQKGVKPGPERFSVAASDDGFVMIEQRTGRTWTLEHFADDTPTWVPIDRVDDPDKARKWRETRDAEWQEMEEQEKRANKEEADDNAKQDQLESQLTDALEQLKNLHATHDDSDPGLRAVQNRVSRLKVALEKRRLQKELERHVCLLHVVETRLDEATAKRVELGEDNGEYDKRRFDTANEIQVLKKAVRDLLHEIEHDEKELREAPTVEFRQEKPTGNADAPDLAPLLLEEELLLSTNGPQHPKVIEVRKKIELTRRFLSEKANSEKLETLQRELFPLLVEEELLLQNHGEGHPKVQEVRFKIAVTRKHLAE